VTPGREVDGVVVLVLIGAVIIVISTLREQRRVKQLASTS